MVFCLWRCRCVRAPFAVALYCTFESALLCFQVAFSMVSTSAASASYAAQLGLFWDSTDSRYRAFCHDGNYPTTCSSAQRGGRSGSCTDNCPSLSEWQTQYGYSTDYDQGGFGRRLSWIDSRSWTTPAGWSSFPYNNNYCGNYFCRWYNIAP